MWWIIVFILIVVAIIAIVIYNGVISAKNKCAESKSAIDTVLQNRYDLIPNLVEVVKQYVTHEKTVLEDITKLRSAAMETKDLSKDKLDKENQISGTLKTIFALSENYPDLKANQNFIQLQNQRAEIEDRLQAARRWYNAAVKVLNDKKQMFPSSLFAAKMTIPAYDMFEVTWEEVKQNLSAKELFISK